MKKLIVFGATGTTGRAILRRALCEKGVDISVFARTPTKIPLEMRPKLNIIQGDVLDPGSVENALSGQDIVISCLGKGKNLAPTTDISNGVKNIISGMRKQKVDNLFVVTLSSLLPTSKRGTPFFLRGVGDDHKRMMTYLRDDVTDIRWCAVCVGEIFDLPPTGNYKAAIDERVGRPTVVAADIAEWMMSVVSDDHQMALYARKHVGVTSSITLRQFAGTFQGRTLMTIVACVLAVVAYFVWG